MGDKLPQSTPVLVRRLKRVAANCLKASRAATTDADRISWNARANTCWQCVARLEELSLRATGEGDAEAETTAEISSRDDERRGDVSQERAVDGTLPRLRADDHGLQVQDSAAQTLVSGAPVAVSLDAQLLPVYFGLVAVLAEVLGPDTYKVEARHLPAWARARLSEVVKR